MSGINLTWFGEPLEFKSPDPNEAHTAWMVDTEYGEALQLLKRGDMYALITTNMESGSARYFHAVVRFPENGEWERIEGEEGISAFYGQEEE